MSDFYGHINMNFEGLEKLTRDLQKNVYVDVGILGSKDAVQTDKSKSLNLAEIGAVHEFGSPVNNIPRRSFIVDPIVHKQDEIQGKAEKVFADKLEKGDVKGIFKIIGISAEAAIQEAFETGGFGEWPDIEDETKARKKSDSILIDKGTLRKGISSAVGGV